MAPEDLEQAARWHARMSDVPDGSSRDAAQAGFAAWHQTSDDHRRAFAAVAAIDGVARELRHEPALQALGDAALARALAKPHRRPRWSVIALIGTVIVAPVAALTLHRMNATPQAPTPPARLQVIATGIGERRVVDLAGSIRVTLDTASKLVINGSTLGIDGQAYVRAGKIPATLRLRGGTVVVRSGGVNIRTSATGATIFAEEATATARLGVNASKVIALRRGYVLQLRPIRSSITAATDPAAITSWRRGWLLFDDMPLTQAAAEINRYRRIPIRLAHGAGGMRISGSFRTDGATDFLSSVAATLPATINRAPSGQTTIVPVDRKMN